MVHRVVAHAGDVDAAAKAAPLVWHAISCRGAVTHRAAPLVSFVLVAAALAGSLDAQPAGTMPANDLHKVRGMLRDGYETVRKHYYDPTFRGLDWDARFRDYDEKLKTAPTMNAGLTLVAAFLGGLNDSHTTFQPPPHSFTIDYGYYFTVIGDNVFVDRVRPGTDAAAKVRPGDQLISLNGGGVGRESFRRMQYLFNTLQPQPTTRLALRDPAGAERTVVVETVVTRGRAVRNLTGAGAGMELQELERELEDAVRRGRPRYVERHGVLIWKLPHFVVDNSEIDRMFGLAKGRRALVLDLRGNPGGLITALNRAIANVFPADVTFATRAGRRGRDQLMARGRGDAAFTGALVVLVDSASASSAEIFARTVQLRKRGLVIGDRTAGAVMEARVHPFARGEPIALLYQFLVTDADIVMPDGKSLEGAGVVPDELLLPTAADLAAGRDPALARAAALTGLDLDAAAAGQLFPVEWK
jgi:carboxyl-terminal processing protease